MANGVLNKLVSGPVVTCLESMRENYMAVLYHAKRGNKHKYVH